MPKNQPVRIIDSKRAPATGGGSVVTPGHTHDDRYVLLTTYTAADVLAKLLTVDGSGSLLDADTVDGQHAAAFAAAAHTHAYIAEALLTTRGDIIRRGASAPERYGLVVPASPTINVLAVANGESDPSWKSASANPGAAAAILQSNAAGGLQLQELIVPVVRPSAASATTIKIYPVGTRALVLTNIGITAHPFTDFADSAYSVGDISQTRTLEGGLNFRAFDSQTAAMAGATIQFIGHRKGESATQPIVTFNAYTSNGGTGRQALASTSMLASFRNAEVDVVRVMADGLLKLSSGVIAPFANGTTALQLANAAGTGIVIVDTTNKIVTVKDALIVNEDGAPAGDFRAESDTEANMVFLDASADALYLGGTTTGVKVAKGGDTTFLGDGSGLPYGSCYGNEIGWTQASAAQDTWYEVSDADMADGELNLVTHDGSGKLTVSVAGRYLINYTCSAEVSLPGKHVQSGISISGTESAAGISHYNAATANEQFNVAGTAILDLAANATVEVSLRTTDTGTPDIAVDHLNLTIVMVGGS